MQKHKKNKSFNNKADFFSSYTKHVLEQLSSVCDVFTHLKANLGNWNKNLVHVLLCKTRSGESGAFPLLAKALGLCRPLIRQHHTNIVYEQQSEKAPITSRTAPNKIHHRNLIHVMTCTLIFDAHILNVCDKSLHKFIWRLIAVHVSLFAFGEALLRLILMAIDDGTNLSMFCLINSQ